MTEGIYERAKQEVRDHWDMWGGLSTGVSFQFMETYPGVVETITGLEIPEQFFQETLNDVHADKPVHLVTSYGGNRGLVRAIDSLPFDPGYRAVWVTCQTVTLGLGAYKEFERDGYPDPLDMLANQVGAHYAARKYRMELEEDHDAESEKYGLEESEYIDGTLEAQETDD